MGYLVTVVMTALPRGCSIARPSLAGQPVHRLSLLVAPIYLLAGLVKVEFRDH